MRRDHRPYFIKKAYLKFQQFYVQHFLRPQFEFLGEGHTFIKPWHVEIFGTPVELGPYANVIAAADNKIRLSVWSGRKGEGHIRIGSYCLICPGVRIGSAAEITIGDNCMLATGVYIMDSDWHGVYNRIGPGRTDPIHIEDNVWIADSVIVCKGVTIGENSVIGAGTVVIDAVPANCIAAGNPARVVRQLDPREKITTRAQWFANPARLSEQIDQMDRQMLQANTLRHWLRWLLFPANGD